MAKTVAKTVVVKVGAYIVSIDRKTTVYRLEACEIAFFDKGVPSCSYSNLYPYFTDLPVSSTFIVASQAS